MLPSIIKKLIFRLTEATYSNEAQWTACSRFKYSCEYQSLFFEFWVEASKCQNEVFHYLRILEYDNRTEFLYQISEFDKSYYLTTRLWESINISSSITQKKINNIL